MIEIIEKKIARIIDKEKIAQNIELKKLEEMMEEYEVFLSRRMESYREEFESKRLEFVMKAGEIGEFVESDDFDMVPKLKDIIIEPLINGTFERVNLMTHVFNVGGIELNVYFAFSYYLEGFNGEIFFTNDIACDDDEHEILGLSMKPRRLSQKEELAKLVFHDEIIDDLDAEEFFETPYLLRVMLTQLEELIISEKIYSENELDKHGIADFWGLLTIGPRVKMFTGLELALENAEFLVKDKE